MDDCGRSLALHGITCDVVLCVALAGMRGASACCGERGSGGKRGGVVLHSGGNGRIAWTLSLMMQVCASVVVLWWDLVVPRRSGVCRRNVGSLSNSGVVLNSGGSGGMAWWWTQRLPWNAGVLVEKGAAASTG